MTLQEFFDKEVREYRDGDGNLAGLRELLEAILIEYGDMAERVFELEQRIAALERTRQ